MPDLQERVNELLNERNQFITRVSEINGALKELERLINETTPTEEETNG